MFLVTGMVPGSITVARMDARRVRFIMTTEDRHRSAVLDVPPEQAREFAHQILTEIEPEGES